MNTLSGKVAMVTGASRGIGRGVAMGLGEAGATVYITGRTLDTEQSVVAVSGTLQKTAAEVAQLGGQGIAVRCDHRDDAQVEAAFAQVQREQGKLDILVNSAWAGYEGYIDERHAPPFVPFWDKPLSFWDENYDGVRWAYAASWFGAKMMVKQRSGLIINISVHVPDLGNPAYNALKTAVDRLTAEMAHQLREHNVAVVSLYPGLVRTEIVLINAQYFDMTTSESPLFDGRVVAALAADPNLMQRSGQALMVSDLAREYGVKDVDDNPFS